MIVVRPYAKKDEAAVRAMHASSGVASSLELDHLLPISAVIVEEGKITTAAILRRTAEIYFVAGKQSKRERLGRVMMLQNTLIPEARKMDIGEIHGWVPEAASDNLQADRLMLRLGWKRPLWTCYALEID